MDVVVYSVDNEKNIIKVIAMDPLNNIMVVDIMPDNTACILDYYEDAYVGIKPHKLPEQKPAREERS